MKVSQVSVFRQSDSHQAIVGHSSVSHQSVSKSVNLSLSEFVCVSICLSVCLFVSMSVACAFVLQHVCLPVLPDITQYVLVDWA